MVTVDMTKVELKPKAMLMLAAAFTVVLVIFGVAQVGSKWVGNVMKGAAKGVTEKVEEAF